MVQKTHVRHVTKPQDKIPVYSKAAYGSGSFVLQIGNGSVQLMANVIYNIELGLSLGLIGLAMMIFRIFDAVLDPFVGNLSDNTRSRYGRRRPYIFLGAILAGITFPLIWWVPAGLSTYLTFAFFLFTAILFYSCFTVFSVPWESFSAELSPDYHERTSVVSYRVLMQMLAATFTGWIYAITQLSVFDSPLEGMRWTAIAIGILIIAFGILPALFCKERFHQTSARQPKIGFVQSLRASLSNKPFRIVLGMLALLTIGENMIVSLGQYLNIYYVFDGAKAEAAVVQGYMMTAKTVAAFIMLPASVWISRQFGKRRLLVFALCLYLIATASKWVLITPDHPNWQIILNALLGLGSTPFWVALVAMIGDVADHDEMSSGARREGSFTAIYTWTFKFSLAMSLFLGNLILGMTGFELDLAGAQSPETFLWMRVMLIAVTVVALLGCLWLTSIYPITEDRAYRTREELENRRGVV